MDELLAQFVVEARELTQQSADDLLALERQPGSLSHLTSAFRAVHTLKGSTGLFPFGPLQAALHAAEDVLSAAMAAGEMDADLVDPVLAIVEWTDRCVDFVAANGVLPDSAAVESLELMRPLTSSAPVEPAEPDRPRYAAWANALFEAHGDARVVVRYEPSAECFFNGDDPLALVSAVPSLLSLSIMPRENWPAPEDFDPFRANLVLELASAASHAEVAQIFRLLPDQVAIFARGATYTPKSNNAAVAVAQHAPSASIRVDAGRVDKLLDIVGELYAVRDGLSRLGQMVRAAGTEAAVGRQAGGTLQQFDRLLAQLRDGVMGVRMVSLAQTFRRLPRVVRETALQAGKKVNVEISGEQIQADRSIVEALFEPLLHIIRNAIDHGLEPAEARAGAGKPAAGKLSIHAQSAGAQISIAVSDDGRGIDLERVKRVAVQRKLIDEGRAALLQRDEILELLFAPGFSTAATVTELSGRGVGMDAVRAALRSVGGSVSIATEDGHGTTIELVIPVSFSMSRLLTVAVGGEWYGIPLSAIVETIRISKDALFPVRASRAFVLRDRTIPFLALGDVLDTRQAAGDDSLVLVVQTPGGPVGLGVDAIGERAEIMVRPLTGLLKASPRFAGTTVLGDGRVLMILDVESLAG